MTAGPERPTPTAAAPRPALLTPPARRLLPLVIPSLVVGVMCALTLIGLSELAGQIEHFLFSWCPKEAGFGSYAWPWVLLILTLAGVVVGLIVWKVPGHAGSDPATLGLVEAPQPLRILPSVGMAAVAALGMGVSLGPENPIIGINVGLTGAIGRRIAPKAPVVAWIGLAASGTIGALFGTPVAAALLLSEMAVGPGDAAVGPAVRPAGGRGHRFDDRVPDLDPDLHGGDPAVAHVRVRRRRLGHADRGRARRSSGSTAVYAFPLIHRVFHAVRPPAAAAGGRRRRPGRPGGASADRSPCSRASTR